MERGDQWRAELLQGVVTLEKKGRVPGQVVVFGSRAEAILTGAGPQDVLVAAAELGQGRLVVISHNGFVKNTGFPGPVEDPQENQLLENVTRWVTRGRYSEPGDVAQVCQAMKAEGGLGQFKAVYDHSCSSGEVTEEVLQYVKSGGALIHAMCPWGWLQLNPGKSLEEMPLWPVLCEAGVCYNDHYIKTKQNRFATAENQAQQSHVTRTLESFFQSGHLSGNTLDNLTCCPKDVLKDLNARFADHLTPASLSSCIPSEGHPIKDEASRAKLSIWEALKCGDEEETSPAPGCELFPGHFQCCPPLTSAELTIQSKDGIPDTYSTGYYAMAGRSVKIEVVGGVPAAKWKASIGAHTDNLSGKSTLKRWPVVSAKVHIKNACTTLTSAFGGLVYLQSCDKKASTLRVKIHNVVEAPHFNIQKPQSLKDWPKRRKAPGLWADIEGLYMTLTLPSSSVRHIDDPSGVMVLWDDVVRAHHDLRGTDPDKHRRQFVVTDIQPSAGYMHSGYPIVTHMDVANPTSDHFLLNSDDLLNKGKWGLYHEIGHNMQRPEWTYEGTGEVTCNIFTLHAMEVVSGQKPWIHEWLQGKVSKARKYIAAGADFNTWKGDPGIALFIYAQVAHHFGWEVYKKVFREYEGMAEGVKPRENQDKIDQWWARVSIAAGHDLTPLLRVWGIPFTDNFTQSVQHLPAFHPSDEITSPGC